MSDNQLEVESFTTAENKKFTYTDTGIIFKINRKNIEKLEERVRKLEDSKLRADTTKNNIRDFIIIVAAALAIIYYTIQLIRYL